MPVMETASGKLLLRNIAMKIIKCSDTDVLPANDCAGEIFLRNPLLKTV